MNKKSYRDILDAAAADSLSRNTNLMSKISVRLERKPLMKTLRTRPVLTLLIAILILFALTGVVYALGRAFGYIPGVGLVDQGAPLRVLAEPVVAQRVGLTITVSEVVADSAHTFVAYTVDGIFVSAKARPTCGALPALQLPDGSSLNILGEDDGGPRGAPVGSIMKLEQSVTYASIPAGVDHVTFTFPCILPEGTGPENWQIPVKLSSALKDFTTPAVEIGATFVASNPTFATIPTSAFGLTFTPETNTSSSLHTPAPSSNASGLHLEKVIELPNTYILVGNFTDAGDLPGPLEINLDPHADLPHMEDGAGNPIAFKVREDIQPENMLGGVRYWAYEIPKPVQGPLTITLDQVNIAITDTAQISFDAGPHPQVGQKWELNLPIRLQKYDYVIDSVEAIRDGYRFRYHSGLDAPEGVSLDINIPGHSSEQNNISSALQRTVVEYSQSLTYPSPLPTSQLTVELSLTEAVPLQGPWSLVWTPSTNKP